MMKIEPNIIDEKIEKEGLYSDTTVNALQEKLDTINFQLDSVNLQLNGNDSISVDEKARLLAERNRLETEIAEIEQKISELKEHEKEDSEFESADTFKGSLEENAEELYSARSIGKATVPKALTADKKEARKVEEDIIKSDKQINDEFKKEAEDMMSRMDDLFR